MAFIDLDDEQRAATSPSHLQNHALHRTIVNEDGEEENRTFVFEPLHPRRKSIAELRVETAAEVRKKWTEGDSSSSDAYSSDDSDTDEPTKRQRRAPRPLESAAMSDPSPEPQAATSTSPSQMVSFPRRDTASRPVVVESDVEAYVPSHMRRRASEGDGPEAAVSAGATRWYRDGKHTRGWSPGTALMQARPMGLESVHAVLATRPGSRGSRPTSRQATPSRAVLPDAAVVEASPPRPLPLPRKASKLINLQLQRPPSALSVPSPDKRSAEKSRIVAGDSPAPKHSSRSRDVTSPTAAQVGASCHRCAAKVHQGHLRSYSSRIEELERRALCASSTPSAIPGARTMALSRPPGDFSGPAPVLPLSRRSIARAKKAKAIESAPPYCKHHVDLGGCPACEVTRTELAAFECLAMETAKARSGEDGRLARPMGADSDDDDDDDADINGADAQARAAARRDPDFNAMLNPLRDRWRIASQRKQNEGYSTGAQPADTDKYTSTPPPKAAASSKASGSRTHGRVVSTVTIAELYAGTTHRDRENLYISVMGGLTFDLTREKFRTMVTRVLAPRAGIVLSDELVLNLFSQFDINNGGTVSYFEYLTALCEHIMSKTQLTFCRDLYTRLRATATAALSRKPSPQPHIKAQRGVGRRQTKVLSRPADDSIATSERLPYFSREGEDAPHAALPPGLGADDISVDNVEKVVFDLLNKSLLFPHPDEAHLASLVHACFSDLTATDRVESAKFVLLMFCDDEVMCALRKHVK